MAQGCGRGYDVITLALHGFDAYGLEISETAVSEAGEFAEKELTSPQECNFGKAWKENPGVFQPGKGKAQFVEGDFFDAAWLEGLDVEQFDVIYDYTVSDFFLFPFPLEIGFTALLWILGLVLTRRSFYVPCIRVSGDGGRSGWQCS